MSTDMVMPKMGESITEGTILKWLKQEGDAIEQDEIILEISTDKVDSEIPSPSAGVLTKILAQEGDTVEVGSVIAQIGAAGDGAATVAAAESTPEPVAAEAPTNGQPEAVVDKTPAEIQPAVAEESGERRFYSPLVKSIARKEGVSADELAAIPGSGKGGRVNKDDILNYIENRTKQPAAAPAMPQAPAIQPASAPAPSMPSIPAAAAPSFAGGDTEIIEMDRMRQAIAAHMVQSKQTSPHVYSFAEADVTHLVKYREAVKASFQQQEGFKLTYTPFFFSAAAKALREFPIVNSSVEGSKIILKKNVNIGMAVALEKGLIVPVIKNADTLNLLGMSRTMNDLALRARSKKLMPEEVQGGTFSITNVGVFGSLYGTPIINQPQVGILGLGVIKKRVVVVNDAIAIRDMVYISLGYDHRIVDGEAGGKFLQRVVYHLENMDPEKS